MLLDPAAPTAPMSTALACVAADLSPRGPARGPRFDSTAHTKARCIGSVEMLVCAGGKPRCARQNGPAGHAATLGKIGRLGSARSSETPPDLLLHRIESRDERGTGHSLASLLQLRPSNRLSYEMPSLGGVAPAADLNPLAGFEVLIVFEEVLDLPQRDLRQVGVVTYI